MPFYFSPSIQNYHQNRFDLVYLDTSFFVSGAKKTDAYTILEDLCNDLMFTVFQSVGSWYLEGLNKRNLLSYNTVHYDVDGVFIESIQKDRLLKEISNHILATPNVTTVSPYGVIEIETVSKEPEFPSTIPKENNDGWAVTTGVNPEIYATDWIGTYFAKAVSPDYNVTFYNNNTNAFNASKKVSLLKKVYLKELFKYEITFTFKILDNEDNQELNLQNSWNDPINYDIKINDTLMFSNVNGILSTEELLKFVDTKSIDLTFEFVAPENGLLDVVFYQPYKTGQYIVGVQLVKMDFKEIGFEDSEVFLFDNSEAYTKTYENQLQTTDDATGLVQSFLLDKLYSDTANFEVVTLPILYGFQQNDNYYSVVQLDAANLIKENIDAVFLNDLSTPFAVNDVVYNYQGNEQMVVVHDQPGVSGNFLVKVFYRDHGPEDRSNYYHWTDSVYGIEKLRLGQCYLNVVRRMFPLPFFKVDLNVEMPILFNNILRWNYYEEANYFITNLTWYLDRGETQVSMSRAIYQTEDVVTPGDNIPPQVLIDNDVIYISQNQTLVQVSALASDPDGFIASVLWTLQQGVPGPVIQSPLDLNTSITNLTQNYYKFRCTVEDNDGATAFDELEIIRVLDYNISLTEILNTNNTASSGTGQIVEKHYQLTCTPALPDNFNLTIGAQYEIELHANTTPSDEITTGWITVEKNGVNIVEVERSLYSLELNDFQEVIDIPFNYNNTDTIIIKLKGQAEFSPPDGTGCSAEVDININTITFASGNGNITTSLPLNEEAYAQAP